MTLLFILIPISQKPINQKPTHLTTYAKKAIGLNLSLSAVMP